MQASGPPVACCGAAYLWGRHSCLRLRPARHGSLPGQAVFVGHAFLWGRLSSLRPAFQPAWAPLTDCHPCAQSRPLPWSMPPGLPCRPLRGARSLACHTGSHAGGRLPSPALPQAPVCGAGSSCGARLVMWGRLSSLRPAFQPAWAPLTDCHPCAQSRPLPWSMPPGLPCRPLRGARSLACHTGSHAGGRLSSPALPQAPVCGAGSSCGAGFSCGARLVMWGRLSSLRPAFQPALAPFTDCHPCAQSRPLPWSKPPGLPCRRSRRQSHTIPSCAGVPTPCGPQDCALQLKPPPPCAPGSLCGARLSSRPGRPSPTALCSFPVLCPAGELHCPASVSSRTHAYISQPH